MTDEPMMGEMMGKPFDLEKMYRANAVDQFPMVPEAVIYGLPLEGAGDEPYLHQSGGWVMVIVCGDRRLGQETDDTVAVAEYVCETGERCGWCAGCCEGSLLYEGGDFDAAWAVLTA